jgi:hypothetical protein
MKNITLFLIMSFLLALNLNAAEKKGSILKEKLKLKTESKLTDTLTEIKKESTLEKKLKLKTDSKITNWFTGKEKFKIPNPVKVLKKVSGALSPFNKKKP